MTTTLIKKYESIISKIMKEKVPDEIWDEIGIKTTMVQKDLLHLNLSYSKYLSNSTCYWLDRAASNYSKFRTEAEAEMFASGGPQGYDVFFDRTKTPDALKVFYSKIVPFFGPEFPLIFKCVDPDYEQLHLLLIDAMYKIEDKYYEKWLKR